MDPLFRLDDMLSEFRPLFKHNNFNHYTRKPPITTITYTHEKMGVNEDEQRH